MEECRCREILDLGRPALISVFVADGPSRIVEIVDTWSFCIFSLNGVPFVIVLTNFIPDACGRKEACSARYRRCDDWTSNEKCGCCSVIHSSCFDHDPPPQKLRQLFST